MEVLGLPATLLDASNKTVPTSSLAGHPFALYFSAHWCPPCRYISRPRWARTIHIFSPLCNLFSRQFTPVLSAWYKKNFLDADNPDKQFSIVFLSSDRSSEDFDGYHKEMNFHALAFADRDIKTKLSKKLGVKGIPTFIIFDAAGNVVSTDGRRIVDSDPDAVKYPWVPKSFAEEMGGVFVGPKAVPDFAALTATGKHVAYYFSAHWCPPCRKFTPELVKTYNAMVTAGTQFEIVFVSADRSDEAFEVQDDAMVGTALRGPTHRVSKQSI